MKQTRSGSQNVPEESFLGYFDGDWDPDLSCILFHSLTNGTKEEDKEGVLHELIHQMAPLVQLVATVEINPGLGGHNIDVVKLEALEYLYFMLLSKSSVPPHVSLNSWTFTRYFWTVIKRGMHASIRKNYDQPVFDPILCGLEEPIYGRVLKHDDIEHRLYLDQFYKTVLKVCAEDIRFKGVERRACIYIGMCIVGLLDFEPMSAKYRFGLNNIRTKFLVSYMEHLVKATVREVRRVDEEI